MILARTVALAAYYLFARHLPASNSRSGKWARPIRRCICRAIFKYAGRNINVEQGAYFGNGAQLEIGDNSGIGVRCQVVGPVKLGRNVMMGPEVIVLTTNHKFDRLDIPMSEQGHKPEKPVVIDDDIWIGTRVIILPGVHVARGAILGAGAVVTKDVPEYGIVGGNPARIIGYRNKHRTE